MGREPAFAARIALAVLVVAATACNLIDANITDIDFELPAKEFKIDTEQWEIEVEGDTFPPVACDEIPSVCSTGATRICSGAMCFGRCGDSGTCEMLVLVDLSHAINLSVEAPQLSSLEGTNISVTIQEMWYDVTANTMIVDSPPLDIYVAPADVFASGDPRAEKVGTIPAVAANQLVQEGQFEFTDNGRSALARYMEKYADTFNIVIGATMEVRADDPIPKGAITTVVSALATASL